MTREHLWPRALHRRILSVNEQNENYFWMRRTNSVIKSEPTIKDVCEVCNNVILSGLDEYICQLFDKYFHKIMERHESFDFHYDYDKLKRWLLKMCYNSSRTTSSIEKKSPDIEIYQQILPYILGKNNSIGRSSQMYLQISYPSLIPSKFIKNKPETENKDIIFYPSGNRVGFTFFKLDNVGKKLLRTVHLRSFTFYIAFFEPSKGASDIYDFSNEFTKTMPGTHLLKKSKTSIRISCNGADSWKSFYEARANEFVFDE
ncbi:MAG: hypothetical protein PW843_10080 [Azospirillaceae bacterium]|nr:hypothetical protein [Azospirillaceae bacterium]